MLLLLLVYLNLRCFTLFFCIKCYQRVAVSDFFTQDQISQQRRMLKDFDRCSNKKCINNSIHYTCIHTHIYVQIMRERERKNVEKKKRVERKRYWNAYGTTVWTIAIQDWKCNTYNIIYERWFFIGQNFSSSSLKSRFIWNLIAVIIIARLNKSHSRWIASSSFTLINYKLSVDLPR